MISEHVEVDRQCACHGPAGRVGYHRGSVPAEVLILDAGLDAIRRRAEGGR